MYNQGSNMFMPQRGTPKNFWAIIIGAVIICIGIIIVGIIMANSIKEAGQNAGNRNDNTTIFGNPLTIQNSRASAEDSFAADTYLSEAEAAAFLKLTDDEFQQLLQSGAYGNGVTPIRYTTIQGHKIFSKRNLAIYIGQKMVADSN